MFITYPDEAMNDKNKQYLFEQMPVPKAVAQLSIPTILGCLVMILYNLADTYFVSGLGTNATAAVSVNANLDQIIMMAGSMLAVGANSYVARLLGARQKEKADKGLSTAFFLAFGFGAVILLLGSMFMEPMVDLLGATDTCRQYSIDYATYVLYAAPFMAANFVMNQCLRSEGSATLSMIGMGAGGILNVILDPIFIMPWGLNMGVAGASLATAISKWVSFAILIFPYITRRSLLHLSIRNYYPSKDIVTKIISVGSSSMFRSGLAVVSAILLNSIAGSISDSVLAAVGVCNKVMMFPFSIILGFGTGFQPVAGFNYGAKRFDRVHESYRFCAKVALIGSLIMAVFVGVLADTFVVLFAGTDEEMRRIGVICMVSQCVALPVHGWVAIVNMLCAGLGNAKGALILSTSRQGTCFLPILYPLAWLFGAFGIACVQAIADILSLVLAIPILKRTRKAVSEAEQAWLAEQNP